MIKTKIAKINELLLKKYGVPQSENPDPDPVDILIATILSQNTNDKNSYRAYISLKKKFPAWEQVAEAEPSEIGEAIKSAGFSSPKSRAIKNFLNYLIETYGKITLAHLENLSTEEAIKELTSHKGIGIKTASCVMMFAFHRNICPVDTHIFRIFNRTGIIKAATPEKVSLELNKNMPEGVAHSLHVNLIRFGREICRQPLPNCSICPVVKQCAYEYKNLTEVEKATGGEFVLLDHIK